MGGIKKSKGVTMLALVITIIVLTIIISITFELGQDVIQNSKVESHLTNMMAIKSKAKIMAEEVNAQVWNIEDLAQKKEKKIDILTKEPYMLKTSYELNADQINQIDDDVKSNNYEYYEMTDNTLEYMKLSGIGSGESYVVVYNSEDYSKLDIVFILGIKYKNRIYYTLSELQKDNELN